MSTSWFSPEPSAALIANAETAAPAPAPTPAPDTKAEGTPAEDAPPADAPAEPSETEPPEGDEPSQEAPIKDPTRYQRRLTQAQQELEYWKTEALKQKTAPTAPASAAPQGKPNFADFGGDIEKYTDALTDWKVAAQFEQHRARDQQQQVATSYQQRAAEFTKHTPDFDEVLADAPNVSSIVIEALAQSDLGPQLAYHLAKDAAAIARLNALPPARQLVELGKLEAQLAPKAAQKAAPKVTNAPKPLDEVKGSTVNTPTKEELAKPGASQADWRAMRKAQGYGR